MERARRRHRNRDRETETKTESQSDRVSDIDRQTYIGRETEKEKQKLVKNSHSYIPVQLPQ